MSEFKGTKGKWEPIFVGDICIGVGSKGENITEVVCNSILPDSDDEYDQQSEQILSDMKIISCSKELLEMVERLTNTIDNLDKSMLSYGVSNRLHKAILTARELIKKATS